MTDRKIDAGEIALRWWNGLQPQTDANGKVLSHGDAGTLARLRRASMPVDALAEAPAIVLAKRLGVRGGDTARLMRIGALAGVLAHVKAHSGTKHMAQLLGPNTKDDQGAMSALRFRRLMAASRPEDLMREMRSAVKLLKGSANIKDMAKAFCCWSDTTRVQWTYNYWGAGVADPSQTNTDNQ